jgi:NTE family protein
MQDHPPHTAAPASPVTVDGYETIALVLQGGGALGAYQAGVYEALHEAGVAPNRYAGISIGAINVALIAGNRPENRVARLREFWEGICRAGPFAWLGDAFSQLPGARVFASAVAAGMSLVEGQPGFFRLRMPPPLPGIDMSPERLGYYDTSDLRTTLDALIDWDLLNAPDMPVALGAVDVASANFVYFDSQSTRVDARHVMASGALPPAFPPVEIDGRWYWDGGIVSNTPLEYVLEAQPRRDTLAFQVDLWSARGEVPTRIDDAMEREKDIRFSSRTRKSTDRTLDRQRLRRAIAAALPQLPESLYGSELWQILEENSCRKVFNVVHLIYQARAFQSHYKDYEFSLETMREHWRAGYEDTRASLARPDFMARPRGDAGVCTHDIHRVAP